MKILLCCETFSPGTGGVQKMMYELGLQFVSFGHDVSVATSYHVSRDFNVLDGIRIHSFNVRGNDVSGMTGDVDKYQDFLVNGDYDCLLVMAAQQWTLDAMLPALKDIRYKKLHIPCGYSGFYQKKYNRYYKKMENYLGEFDQLIYNATDYRDINFARSLGLDNKINVIPAGASESEFGNTPNLNVRDNLGINRDDFVILTVGNPPYSKGHGEVLRAYGLSKLVGNTVLVLNGEYDKADSYTIKEWLKSKVRDIIGRSPSSIRKIAKTITDKNKKVIFTELERSEMVSLFFEADLFVFASYVEYSPLVIYECLAAGLPFISVPVGNTEEIVENSHGGVLCRAEIDKEGFTKTDPNILARELSNLQSNRTKLEELHVRGREAWEQFYTWNTIAKKIEGLFIKHECVQ